MKAILKPEYFTEKHMSLRVLSATIDTLGTEEEDNGGDKFKITSWNLKELQEDNKMFAEIWVKF